MIRFLSAALAAVALVSGLKAAELGDSIVALPDPAGINPPDYVLYAVTPKNRFDVFSGQTGMNLRSVNFFSDPWNSIAMAAFADGNSDGTADDPALAVLGQNINTGQLKVQSRDAVTGAVIHNVVFFSSAWTPIAVAILEDSNGDGTADDPAAALLAQRDSTDGRIMVELRRLSDGLLIGKWAFFRPTWVAKAVVAFVPEGGVPRVAVLGTDPGNGHSKVWIRQTTDGAVSRQFFYGAAVDTYDLGVLRDLDGNGTADDPGLVVLGRQANGNNTARIRRVSDGSKVDDLLMVGSAYGATGLAMLGDINMSNYEDIAVLAEPTGGGSLLVKLRDLGTGTTINNVFLDKDTTPDTFSGRTENIYTGDTYDSSEISVDASGREIIRTLLVVLLTPDATNTEVDNFLSEHNAIITASIAGSRSMTIRIPDPGTVEALAAITANMQAESFVDAVYSDKPVKAKDLPSNVMEGSAIDYDFIKHQLAIDGHAAWNAKEAIQSEPNVLVPDFYGAGSVQLTGFLDINLQGSVSSGSGADHGYHVAGILAGDYGGAGTDPGLITGVIPETVNLDVLDLQAGISNANLDAWMLTTAAAKSGTVVLSTSLGDDCTCADNNTWGSQCQNPASMAPQAVTWINQVRGAGLENKLFHATAASNRDSGSTWSPACSDTATTYGYRDAPTSSAWNTAALTAGLMDSMGNPVAPLSNTVVVENLRVSPNTSLNKSEIVCMDENSFVGGNISAVGTDVQSLGQTGVASLSGTSMATPQVAGLAAYLLSIDPNLSPQKIIEILQNTGETPGTTGSPSCSDWGSPSTAINAYAAVLALDDDAALTGSPSDAPVRLAILDAADGAGNEGNNGQFDEQDLQYFIDKIEEGTQNIEELDLTVNYSRTDLNADGYDGGNGANYKKKFNLDIDYPPTYTTVTQMIEGEEVDFDETSLSDTQILCYYAYSSIYTGSNSERETIMDGRCRGGIMAVYVSYYREQSAGQDVGGFGCEALDDEYDEGRETFSTKSIPDSDPFTFVPRALDQYWGPGDTDTEINLRTVNGATNYTVDDGMSLSCVSIPFTSETEFDSTLTHDLENTRLNVDFSSRSRAECQLDPDGVLTCGSTAFTAATWLAEFDFEVSAPLSLTLVMQLNCSAVSNRVDPDPAVPNPSEIGDMDFTYSTRRYNEAGEWIGSLPSDSFACPEDGIVDINQEINLDAPEEPNTTDNIIIRISGSQNTLAPAPILLPPPTEPGVYDIENHMEGYVEVIPAP